MRWALVLLLLLGCTHAVEVTPVPDEAPPEEFFSYADLFRYDEAGRFTYHVELHDGAVLVTTDVSYEESHGEQVLALRTSSTESNIVAVMHVHPETHACEKAFLEQGTESTIEDICPVEGLNSRFADAVVLSLVAGEEVSVPAGTYTAKVYEGDGLTYWVVDDVPVPVQYGNDDYTLQLTSWERAKD